MKPKIYEKVDTQMHTISRSFQELQMLRHCGVLDIISTIYIPIKLTQAGTFYDLIQWLINYEIKRGKMAGVNIHPAVGIHPMMVPSDSKVLEQSIKHIEDAIKTKKVVAIGETGLEKGTQEEFVSFKRHLEIARQHHLPIIIHTPESNKIELTKIIMREIKKHKIEEAVVDHCDMTNVKVVLQDARRDIKIGLSIGKRNLSIAEAIKIYKTYSYENRYVLNSNAGSGDSDYLSMVKAVEAFEEVGLNFKVVQKLASQNALSIFRHVVSSTEPLI
ncbi:MAG: TatD family hydrolase [Promethearchaeota archaeon]